ncbi:uncharacterized protein LOC118190852 [Stegodyphus dumicola]|uniref:uncharacterized protein LOC118190852 n=1 Tax=Stegodyphus dumicola TaxID=202533 RepID=UPI0015B23C4F|nr:uncharacterized protein LOC118190852 [Stegodyphus dumicola]
MTSKTLDKFLCQLRNKPGFSEFRKYKRINETRVITPYQPEIPEQTMKKEEDRTPEIKVSDPRRFIFEEIGFISVESLESLIRMINSYPDLGYVNMSRNHMDLVRDYKPYQYTICNYKDVNKLNYVTMSRNGLVEFYKGDADFLPLERLTTEYELYNNLRQIPSFRTFCLWKAFMVWFKKIRRRKYSEAREKIEAFYIDKYGS